MQDVWFYLMKSCKSGLLEVLIKKSIFKSLKYSKKNIRHREREIKMKFHPRLYYTHSE